MPVPPKVYSPSEARARLYDLLEDAANCHESIFITGKRSSAVLIAEEDWRAVQETLYLLSGPGCGNLFGLAWILPLSTAMRSWAGKLAGCLRATSYAAAMRQ